MPSCQLSPVEATPSNIFDLCEETFDASMIPTPSSPSDIPDEVWNILDNMNPDIRQLYFGDSTSTVDEFRNGETVADILLSWSKRKPLNRMLEEDVDQCDNFAGDYLESISATAEQWLKMERSARQAFRNNKEKFPTAIWHCCKQRCFTSIAIDLQRVPLFEELKTIHSAAEDMHEEVKIASIDPETRRKGIGGSSVAFCAPTRTEREQGEGITPGSNRQRALQKFGSFVLEVLPFLYAQEDAPNGTKCSTRKLCTEAICCLLGVSRNFLYLRKKKALSNKPTEEELSSIVDTAGIRLRQHRRRGDRTGYPMISELPSFECGCFQPCLGSLKVSWLKNEYKAFSACSRALNPRQKENRHLLDVLYCPYSHSPVSICNNALSALYTVSQGHISEVRLTLQQMCDDPSVDHREFLDGGVEGYRKHHRHPMNRYPDRIREKIEKHLDMLLRADPAGGNDRNICRVYSPEINTKEKLRKLMAKVLEEDDSVDDQLSDSTLQRMLDKYLSDRKCTIAFNQNDHNACPNCKTMNYAVLQYYHEANEIERKYEQEYGDMRENDDPVVKEAAEKLKRRLEAKRFQEQSTLEDLKFHLTRDASIRRAIKQWSDYFRKIEKEYNDRWRRGEDAGRGTWNGLANHAIITHQDDMTKVDLPHFVVTVSSDISRWRFDINAHVSAVNDDCVVFSHEQGSGAKNASAITEMILLDHLVRCKGESIKVVVSDNAAVGKNWLTTIALPQYMVDQGLAQVVFMVFLENNHGKWLADMLFGQLQTKKRRTTLLSVDDLLSEFEMIKRRSGRITGLAVNPLSSVDFASVFESLGYETKPPKDFGFVKRNIHFAAACTQAAKKNLSPALKNILGPGLPQNEGMVRISSSPPTTKAQGHLPYEERFFDVPAARKPEIVQPILNGQQEEYTKPLSVPVDQKFSVGGNCVVSQNTAKRVGYNGFEFRKQNGNPELRQYSSRLVRQAWPQGMLKPFERNSESGEPIYGVESVKCGPENWVLRKPVGHHSTSDRDWKARYPPRNFLNARFGKGPRTEHPWIPTQTYTEPPFPIFENAAARISMLKIAEMYQDISKPVDVLDLLRAVFEDMEDREDVVDPWLQRRATVPSRQAIERYQNDLRTFIERGKGEPGPPKTIRQIFKADEHVKSHVERLLQNSGTPAKGAKTKLFNKLFEELENKPGGLDKFQHLVEKDHERYAEELRAFKEKLKEFDRSRRLCRTEEIN